MRNWSRLAWNLLEIVVRLDDKPQVAMYKRIYSIVYMCTQPLQPKGFHRANRGREKRIRVHLPSFYESIKTAISTRAFFNSSFSFSLFSCQVPWRRTLPRPCQQYLYFMKINVTRDVVNVIKLCERETRLRKKFFVKFYNLTHWQFKSSTMKSTAFSARELKISIKLSSRINSVKLICDKEMSKTIIKRITASNLFSKIIIFHVILNLQ